MFQKGRPAPHNVNEKLAKRWSPCEHEDIMQFCRDLAESVLVECLKKANPCAAGCSSLDPLVLWCAKAELSLPSSSIEATRSSTTEIPQCAPRECKQQAVSEPAASEMCWLVRRPKQTRPSWAQTVPLVRRALALHPRRLNSPEHRRPCRYGQQCPNATSVAWCYFSL